MKLIIRGALLMFLYLRKMRNKIKACESPQKIFSSIIIFKKFFFKEGKQNFNLKNIQRILKF
jgi:hypothetical protein